MNFLHPEFLYLLFIIPVLIAFNLFFKGKRTLPVTTLFIWEKFHEECKSSNISFNRLLKEIPLLLQILFVIMSSILLSEPNFLDADKEPDREVFIIDSSIYMNAGTEGNRYLDMAKERAIQLLQDDHRTSRVMIINAVSNAEIVHYYSCDTNQLVDAVRGISSTDTISNLDQAITMAFSLGEIPLRIVVFTCKLPDKVSRHSDEMDIIEWVSVGDFPDNNVFISDLDIRQDFSINRNYQIFLRISNDSDLNHDFKLKVYNEEKLYEVRNVAMSPHETKGLLFSLWQIMEGLIQIKIEVNDDLAVDNEAFILLEPEIRLSILMVTAGNRFLENALTLHGSVDIDLCESSNSEEKIKTGNYDVVIYDNVAIASDISADTIIICSKANEYTNTEKGMISPELLTFNYGHKSLNGLDLSNLSIDKSYILNVPEWGEALIESEYGALMFCGERDNKKLLVTGYDLMQSNFPLEIAFPLFISRVVNWFKGNEHRNWISAGEAYHYTMPTTYTEDSVTVTMPDGEQHINRIKNNSVAITDTMKAGVYRIEGDTFQKRFVVNFQTNTDGHNNVFTKNIIQKTVPVIPESVSTKLGFLFAVLALVALVAEWYFYSRT